MIKGSNADKDLVIDLLTQSFDANQSINYIVRQDESRKAHIRALMDYSFEICYLFGEIWLSDDKKACALLLYPQEKRTTFKTVWLDIKLIFKAIGLGGIRKTLNRESKIKKNQPREDMVYLWFIGVNPADQHHGIGSKLLAEIITEANSKSHPVCLETSTLRNLPWYQRFGFEIYNQLELGYTLVFLKRKPDL
jgi:GNAT superfamily N-acetyltransferase